MASDCGAPHHVNLLCDCMFRFAKGQIELHRAACKFYCNDFAALRVVAELRRCAQWPYRGTEHADDRRPRTCQRAPDSRHPVARAAGAGRGNLHQVGPTTCLYLCAHVSATSSLHILNTQDGQVFTQPWRQQSCLFVSQAALA